MPNRGAAREVSASGARVGETRDLERARNLAVEIIALGEVLRAEAVLSKPFDRDGATERLALTLACANCERQVGRASYYCCDLCAQTADTVRYLRRTIADGRSGRDDIREAIGTKLLMLTGGGYPRTRRRLSASAKKEILERDGFRCQVCGGEATEVDHIAGDSASPDNLRAICRSCNIGRAFGNAPTITAEDDPEAWGRITVLYEDVALRAAAPHPLRLCDDPDTWAAWERGNRSIRRELFREWEDEVESDFEDVDGYLWHTMQKDD